MDRLAVTPRRVAVVGAGASGTLVAAQVLRRATRPVDVLLIDRRPRPGRGVAYGTTFPGHLLNVPAGRMSALPEQPLHFVRWAKQHKGDCPPGLKISPDGFLPRPLYGAYLEDLLLDSGRHARWAQFAYLQADAVDLDDARARVRIQLRDGNSVDASQAVLAIGNFPPTLPRTLLALSAFDSVIGNPWAPGALEKVRPDDVVVVIGTGLTMIDVVGELSARGHRGSVHAVSRHGRLPLAHAPTTAPSEPVGVDDLPHDLSGIVKWVRAEAARAADEGRGAVDALRPSTPTLWQRLSASERRRFLRHLRPYWDTTRHRVAPDVAREISGLRCEGLLVVRAARVLAAKPTSGGVSVDILQRGGHMTSIEATWVVNATGTVDDYGSIDDPLIAGIARRGLARIGRMGIATSPRGALIGSAGHASRTLYTLGPPRKGDLWETVAIPEIRVQAADLARHLLNS